MLTKLDEFKALLLRNPELNERYNKILVDTKYIREEEAKLITFVSIILYRWQLIIIYKYIYSNLLYYYIIYRVELEFLTWLKS